MRRLHRFASKLEMRPFSLRHSKALEANRLQVSIGDHLRRRLSSTLRSHNLPVYYSTPDNPTWTHNTSVAEQAEKKLVELLGIAEYTTDTYGNQVRKEIDLYREVIGGSSVRVFDIIEVFFSELPPDEQPKFQRAINESNTAFACPWRMSEGMFFRVDSSFMEEEVIGRSTELLSLAGLEGAMDEFRTARDHLTDGAARDAITYASHSFESTLKAILKVSSGAAKQLVEQFEREGYMSDVPPSKASAVRKSLLILSVIGNELGRHGQGHAVLEVPREYAELAVNLAGALNLFVVGQHLKKHPPPATQLPKPAKGKSPPEFDDDIPF